MAKERLFNLPETRGNFQLKGIVTGTEKENFYKSSKTKTGRDMRAVNFGVTFDKDKTLYVGIQGFPMDKVYFSKRDNETKKTETIPINWSDRTTFNREGFRLIGNNIGLTKIIDASGNQVNDKKTLTDFDACQEVSQNLEDEQSVFIKGRLEFSSYKADNGDTKRNTKLTASQISLCREIDFSDEDFASDNKFDQVIIFIGIDKEIENEKETGRYTVSAKIVKYSSIEDAEFVIENNKLAMQFKKALKPYTAIKVFGRLDTSSFTISEENDDVWGDSNFIEKVYAPTKRELIIEAAKASTIDKETYSKELIEDAIVKINNAETAKNDYAGADNSNWGDVKLSDTGIDEEPWG